MYMIPIYERVINVAVVYKRIYINIADSFVMNDKKKTRIRLLKHGYHAPNILVNVCDFLSTQLMPLP